MRFEPYVIPKRSLTGSATERIGAYQAVLAAAKRSAPLRTRVHVALVRTLSLEARNGLLP